MATKLFFADGMRTWDTFPQAQYCAATNTIVTSALKTNGTTTCLHYVYDTKRLWSLASAFPTYGSNDSHNTASVMELANGKPVFFISGHNNTLKCRTAKLAGRVGALAAIVTPGENSATYPFPCQMADSAGTLYVFCRIVAFGTPNTWFWRLHTSTDSGATWSAATNWLVDDGGSNLQRPYVRMTQLAGSSRVDFVANKGHWQEVSGNYLGTGYLEVASDGTRSWHKSDGTSLGADAALPLNTSQLTLVAGPEDGVANFTWVDFGYVNGVLTLLYARMTPYDPATTHTLYWTQLIGGAWTTAEAITVSGGPLTDAAWHVPGGAGCLDEHDANAVYLSIKYGAADFRIEKWVRQSAGVWAKAVNITGDTGSMNIFPFRVRGSPNSQILYERGSFVTETDWSMDIWSWPGLDIEAAPTVVQAKPTEPAWQADLAPAGCVAYVPLTEGSGTTVEDFVPGNVHHGTFTGSPVWGTGDYGPQVGSFTTSNYIPLTYSSTTIPGAGFPMWAAMMFEHTGTTAGVVFSFGGSASDTPFWFYQVNVSSQGGASNYNARGSVGTGFNLTVTTPTHNDGNPHVIQVVSWAANYHAIYLDGLLIATNTSNTLSPLPTVNQMTIGLLRRSSPTTPFVNGSIIAAAYGENGAPDPLEFAEDWLYGTFAAIREVTPTRAVARFYADEDA